MIKIFDKRRQQLHHALATNKEKLGAEKQHQIFGAINELNMVIRTMNYQHNQWLKMQNDVGRMSRETQDEVKQKFDDQVETLRQEPFNRMTDLETPFEEKFKNGCKEL